MPKLPKNPVAAPSSNREPGRPLGSRNRPAEERTKATRAPSPLETSPLPFARLLRAVAKEERLSLTMAAQNIGKRLDVQGTYVLMLARGAVTPSLHLAWKIEVFALSVGKRVPMQSWLVRDDPSCDSVA